MIPLRTLALALALLSACGDEPFSLTYEGTPGTAVPMELDGWVPQVQASADGTDLAAMVDTGSPLTLVSRTVLPSATPGQIRTEVQAFGLTFPELQITVSDLFPQSDICDPPHPGGLVGGDLLRAFSLGLDYRGKRAMVFDGNPDGPVGSDTAAPVVAPVDVRGGGMVRLNGVDGLVPVQATRVLTEVDVEGTTHTAVVDSGASLTVVSDALYNGLGGTDRPRLCCETVATIYGRVKAHLGRLKQLSVAGATVKNLPVLVWDDSGFFDAISDEVGRPVSLLLGGSFLRHFAVLLRYDGETLELERYRSQDHVDPDEFVGPGFTMCQATQAAEGVVVVDVYQGSDAEAQGIVPGLRLIAVDGQSTAGLDVAAVKKMFDVPVGTTVDLTFANNVKRTVKVERLLPDYS